MSYLVGIDGGGTSCRARVTTEQGEWLADGKSGSANLLLGPSRALDAIIESLLDAGFHAEQFKDMHIGAALAGAEQASAWLEFMALPHPFASITLNTDAYGACLGAHQGQDGAIMIAGTGSCGILLQQGQQHVVGGREFPISDQGSGAVMGLRLIQQVLLAQDDIRPSTQLTQLIMTHFEHDIDAIVLWSKSALPRDYAQFSPQIFALAQECDPLAIELLQQTAQDIEMFLWALHKKGARQICLMGGIAERIQAWLSPAINQFITTPKGDAMHGALMLANQPLHNLYSRG
ncbi:N-acetylglucosamine kinase [Vibrio gallicus]|uniref:N-acetylglucosamine kinase n=1 Tax=Vibrio gallicus TaxID=190897 RepID=UPI0021C3BE3D|nr:N-acetylglucosamine kinase [Vibrio gallicus]